MATQALSPNEAVPLCACGCGEQVRKTKQRWNRFVTGHNAKGVKQSPEWIGKRIKRMEEHYAWKGGKQDNGQGYLLVKAPGHPHASKFNRLVPEHRLVMEKHLGRYLQPNEHVHHKNHNRRDNRIENLELLSAGKHTALHNRLKAKLNWETVLVIRLCAAWGMSRLQISEYLSIPKSNLWMVITGKTWLPGEVESCLKH